MRSPSPRTASREEQVDVVEFYFDCFVRQDFEALPITPELGRTKGVVVFYDPRRLAGRTEDRS